jgi:hypothetical protein
MVIVSIESLHVHEEGTTIYGGFKSDVPDLVSRPTI